jgi:hypothetical protein
VAAVVEVAQKDAKEFEEIVSLLESEAGADNDPRRVALKRRAARLLTTLIPSDPGFAVGDHVEVQGEVLFISSKENGVTTIKVSDIARIYVATRFVHKAEPRTLSEGIIKLLEIARECALLHEAKMR